MKNLVEKLKEIESKVVENKDNFDKLYEIYLKFDSEIDIDKFNLFNEFFNLLNKKDMFSEIELQNFYGDLSKCQDLEKFNSSREISDFEIIDKLREVLASEYEFKGI